jgi:NADH dehydrogenase FAD-containing subunit
VHLRPSASTYLPIPWHRDLLTFVLVGAGPTGVELAGALTVLVRNTLRSEFKRIDPLSARVVLVELGKRVLGSFAEDLSGAAKRRLERMGVEARLGHAVDQIDEGGVTVAGERIASRTVIWTAGVAPSPAGKWLAVETDRQGGSKCSPISPSRGIQTFSWWATPPRSGTESRSPESLRWRCSRDAMPEG